MFAAFSSHAKKMRVSQCDWRQRSMLPAFGAFVYSMDSCYLNLRQTSSSEMTLYLFESKKHNSQANKHKAERLFYGLLQYDKYAGKQITISIFPIRLTTWPLKKWQPKKHEILLTRFYRRLGDFFSEFLGRVGLLSADTGLDIEAAIFILA